jgi:hypothetical protein
MTTDHQEQIGKLRLEIREMQNDLRQEFLDEIRLIRENHLAHIQKSIESIDGRISTTNVQVMQTSTDMDWVKKFFWIVATTSIAGLVTGLVNLLLTAS